MRFSEIISEAGETQYKPERYTRYPEWTAAMQAEWGKGKLTRDDQRTSATNFMGKTIYRTKDGTEAGFWHTTHNERQGTAIVAVGYGKVAIKPKRKTKAEVSAELAAQKAEQDKVAAAKAAELDPNTPASDKMIIAALQKMMSLMRPYGGNYSRWRDIKTESGQTFFEVRDWGDWETPPDAEDEEDHDWQELTDEYRQKLRTFRQQVQTEFPKVIVEPSPEEKNWIVVTGRSAV